MRVKMNTIMAHPLYGCAHPGDVIDLPDELAKALLEGGNADPTQASHRPAAKLHLESATTEAPENSMRRARPRKPASEPASSVAADTQSESEPEKD